jgi:metal-responsive CopG/Arc/MetJ family transcriptional regulator
MRTSKVAISLEKSTLAELDHLVKNKVFPSRSRAIQEAVVDKLSNLRKTRLAEECSKLDPNDEQALAEEAISEQDTSWPEY